MSPWDAVITSARKLKSAAQGTGLGTPMASPSEVVIALANLVEVAAELNRKQEMAIGVLYERLNALEAKK